MKPFNLQAALNGAKVITRNGRAVKIAGYNPDAETDEKLVGWIKDEAQSWGIDGRYCESLTDAQSDLFMAPTGRKEWIVRVPMISGTPVIFGPLNELGAQRTAEQYRNATIHEITIIE